MDYKAVIKTIREKKYQPIYFLHGEEPFFIDAISKVIAEEVLEESERDFNQTIVYGKDCDPIQVIGLAKQFPMMSERQVVIIREAQDIKNWDVFESYFLNPQPSTILVICHKYKKFDTRKKVYKALAKHSVVFLSDKVRDYQLSAWIMNYVQGVGYGITDKAVNLLAEFLGNDLGKIINELDKLSILLEKGTKINDVHIEENIGISKDYNVFELVNAIGQLDVLKANKIIQYFEQNPKAANIVVIIPNIFTFFQRLMMIHFLPNKSPESIASNLKIPPFVAKEQLRYAKLFSSKKIAQNIGYLHEYDLKSKGVNSGNATHGELLKELVYLLMH
jgi:DNA polymerase III subunit delta